MDDHHDDEVSLITFQMLFACLIENVSKNPIQFKVI